MPTTSPTKPTLAPLDTGKSLAFPSHLHDSPLVPAKFELLKREDTLKTPITPPVAYTEFLKNLTPMITTPGSSTSTRSSSSVPGTSASPYFCNCEGQSRSLVLKTPSSATTTRSQPDRFLKTPGTPRTPRTPLTLRSLRISSAKGSPVSECSPRSASLRSILSPATPAPPDTPSESSVRYLDASRCASCARPVMVRQVITRTITYKRTPLEPAPKGKRRKIQTEEQKK